MKCNNTVTPGRMGPAIVLVNNGLIEDIVEKMPANIHTDCIDIGDKVLLPGFVDTHVHINEPGRTEWEGFNTATRSAIAGGITTLVDMPLNSSPVTTSVASFQFKLEAAKEHLHAHCGFWAGVVPGNHQEIAGLIQAGVFGFKAFLSPSGIVDFPNVNESDLSRVMPLIARHRLPLLVHCELEDTAGLPLQKDPFSYYEYLASRPPAWEHNAVALMTRLCETYNCRVHIVHISSAGSLKIIENAKAKGLPLTAETAQHYLYFEAENISNGRTEFKCAPPIRDRANNDLLWKGLENGTIDFVATDHSPAPPELKQIQTGDFTRAWGGIASLQFAFPALWTEAKKRNFSLVDVCAGLSEKPALLA
ncbi:MAG: allantoinase AllB, partial [Chitinophagaceae bacterium]